MVQASDVHGNKKGSASDGLGTGQLPALCVNVCALKEQNGAGGQNYA